MTAKSKKAKPFRASGFVWTCNGCGKKGVWTKQWSHFGPHVWCPDCSGSMNCDYLNAHREEVEVANSAEPPKESA